MRFGATHPLAILCRVLRQEVYTQGIYETALRITIKIIDIIKKQAVLMYLSFTRYSSDYCVVWDRYSVHRAGNLLR